MTTVIVLCDAKKAAKVRDLMEHWFAEEITIAGQGTTDKQKQGVIIIEFEGDAPDWFLTNLDEAVLVTDYLIKFEED